MVDSEVEMVVTDGHLPAGERRIDSIRALQPQRVSVSGEALTPRHFSRRGYQEGGKKSRA